jgi:hypothetical protein
MAKAATWHLFAYKHDEHDSDEHRKGVPDWRVEDVVRWAQFRGYDAILLTREGETEFVRHPGFCAE